MFKLKRLHTFNELKWVLTWFPAETDRLLNLPDDPPTITRQTPIITCKLKPSIITRRENKWLALSSGGSSILFLIKLKPLRDWGYWNWTHDLIKFSPQWYWLLNSALVLVAMGLDWKVEAWTVSICELIVITSESPSSRHQTMTIFYISRSFGDQAGDGASQMCAQEA